MKRRTVSRPSTGGRSSSLRTSSSWARMSGLPTACTWLRRTSAAWLGRDDIGSVEVGKRADIALFATDDLAHRGAESDPVAALVFCNSGPVRHLFVEGKPVVRDGQLQSFPPPLGHSPSPLAGEG